MLKVLLVLYPVIGIWNRRISNSCDFPIICLTKYSSLISSILLFSRSMARFLFFFYILFDLYARDLYRFWLYFLSWIIFFPFAYLFLLFLGLFGGHSLYWSCWLVMAIQKFLVTFQTFLENSIFLKEPFNDYVSFFWSLSYFSINVER